MRISGSINTSSINDSYKSLSASGSSKDRVRQLTDRKREITREKNEYRAKAAAKGVSQEEIDAKCAEYDNTISEIDSQIMQIKQEEQQKKAQEQAESTKRAAESNAYRNENDPSFEQMKSTQKLITGLTDVQTAKKKVSAVKFAKRVLQTDSLSHQSFINDTSAKNKQIASTLSGTAKALDYKLSRLNKSMNSAAKKIADSTVSPEKQAADKKDSSAKTYEQAAAENYQQIADMANPEDENESGSYVDMLA